MTPSPAPRSYAPIPIGRQWGKSVGAALWPLLCALAFAAYAFFPQRFPEQTHVTLMLLVAAELPMLMFGAVHVAALEQPTLQARMTIFFLGLAVLGASALLHLGFDLDLLVVAPVLVWVLVPYVIDLLWEHPDRELISRQARAMLEDRAHLISLVPSLVLFLALASIASLLLMTGFWLLSGIDLLGEVSSLLAEAQPSWLASIGSGYLLICAASAAHVHRPVFVRDRRRLLDRGWIHRITLSTK